MRRVILLILLAMLIAALPLWPFNRGWSYGPAIAVAFLLAVNLLAPICEFFEGRRGSASAEHRGVPADVAVTPNPGTRHAEGIEASEIDPTGRG